MRLLPILLLWVLSCLNLYVNAQVLDETPSQPYIVHFKYEAPISLALLVADAEAYRFLKKDKITETYALELKKENVSAFDRGAFRYESSGYECARNKSDIVLFTTAIAPAFLYFDKKAKGSLKEISVMYLESQLLSSTIYLSTTALFPRARPYVYNTDLTLDTRTAKGSNNSFFSGHTTATANASFFLATVISDLHPMRNWKKGILYAGASIPPIMVGHYRIKGGMHFRSDVATAIMVGAISGIMVPTWHKKQPYKNVSFRPFLRDGYRGISLSKSL